MRKAIVTLSLFAVALIMASCTLSNEGKARNWLKRQSKIISITQILMNQYQQELIVCLLM